jgi:hypothetical protein
MSQYFIPSEGKDTYVLVISPTLREDKERWGWTVEVAQCRADSERSAQSRFRKAWPSLAIRRGWYGRNALLAWLSFSKRNGNAWVERVDLLNREGGDA